MVITPLLTHAGARGGHEVLGAAVAADPAGGVLGFILPGCEDDGATRLLGVWEGVAILLELALREQVLLEAAVQGGPFRSSTRGLLGRLSEKEIQPVHSEGDQPWDFFGRNDAKAETPVL